MNNQEPLFIKTTGFSSTSVYRIMSDSELCVIVFDFFLTFSKLSFIQDILQCFPFK